MDERSVLQELTRGVPDEDPAARERARVRLLELIEAEGTVSHNGPTVRAPWTAVPLVAAVIGAILLVQMIAGPTRVAGALDLATIALGHGGAQVKTGQYAYTRSVGTALESYESLTGGESWTYYVRVRREIWLASNGSGLLVERYSHPKFITPGDRVAWRQAGSPDLTPDPLRTEFQPGDVSTVPFEEIRGDPLALVQRIRDHADSFHEGELEGDLGLLSEYLAESPSSPELRAAMLELVASMDLAWDGSAVDPRGRPGVGLSMDVAGLRTTLVFDSTNSALMSYVTERIGDPSLVITSYTFVDRGVVNSIRERPGGSGT